MLQRTHSPNYFGQASQQDSVPAELPNGHGGDAGDNSVVLQVVVDAGLCYHHHAIADRHVVGASDLSAEQTPFADSRRAGDSGVAREARVLADFAVVPDMD